MPKFKPRQEFRRFFTLPNLGEDHLGLGHKSGHTIVQPLMIGVRLAYLGFLRCPLMF